MSKGTIPDLARMHGLITRYYNSRLEAELDGDKDEFAVGISPAELTAMNNFLKQNNITVDAELDQGMSELEQRLAEKRQRGRAKLAAVSSITGE